MYAYFLRVQLVCLNALRNKQASVRLRTTAAVNQPVWTLGMTKTVGDSLTPVINEVHQNFCSHPRFCSSTIVWSSAPPRRVTHVLEWSVKLIGKLVVTLSAERSNTASLIDLLTRIQFHCFFFKYLISQRATFNEKPLTEKATRDMKNQNSSILFSSYDLNRSITAVQFGKIANTN